jgi:hypothetical protein
MVGAEELKMADPRLPLIVLGGSDRKSTRLPDDVRDKHPLSGYKGVDIRIGGRPMVETIVELVIACGRFEPVYVVGPSKVYEKVRFDATMIDANGTFGQNIQTSLEHVRAIHPGSPLAFITCDVLPEGGSLMALMAHYDSHAPCDLWFPLVVAPEDRDMLGASAWKPLYRIAPRDGEPALRILPGHLVIVDPEALRLKFLYRLFQLGYRTRNRPIDRRRSVMVRSMLLALLYQDLLHVLGFRFPALTWTVLRAGVTAARELRDGTITRGRLENFLRQIFVKYRHRKRFPDRRVLTPLVHEIWLALDIDTEEEARERGGDLSAG